MSDYHKVISIGILSIALIVVVALMTNCEREVSTRYYQLERTNAVLRATQK